ncbi:hypothetical protein JCM3766R1_006095 [Sporobolomyces carnicolor]
MTRELEDRSQKVHEALDEMLKAIVAHNRIGSRDSDLIESQWKRDFLKEVEPSNKKDVYADKSVYDKIVAKLVRVKKDEKSRFVTRDGGYISVNWEYQVPQFVAGLIPSSSHSLAHAHGRIGLRQTLISNVLAHTNGRATGGGYRFRIRS